MCFVDYYFGVKVTLVLIHYFLCRRVGRSPLNPPPPSRRAGFQGVSNLHSDFCRLLTSDGPRPIRRPDHPKPIEMHFSGPQTPNGGFSIDFLPIENSLKIWLLKNAPKTSKVGSLIAQTSILGSLLGPFWHWFFMDFLKSSWYANTTETL